MDIKDALLEKQIRKQWPGYEANPTASSRAGLALCDLGNSCSVSSWQEQGCLQPSTHVSHLCGSTAARAPFGSASWRCHSIQPVGLFTFSLFLQWYAFQNCAQNCTPYDIRLFTFEFVSFKNKPLLNIWHETDLSQQVYASFWCLANSPLYWH